MDLNQELHDRIDGYALDAVPGHLLRLCQQRAVDLFVDEVGSGGPTPRQFAVLLNVYQNPGMTQTDLVRASGIDRSTLTEILRRMVAHGWVSRRRTAVDQRANALELTRSGKELLAAAFDAAQRAQSRILEPVPPELRASAMELLNALAGRNGSASDGQRPRPGMTTGTGK